MADIIFLGAGASKSEGAPLQGELFEKYFQDISGSTGLPDFEADIETFFRLTFGIDPRERSTLTKGFPTFEEALGVVELALQRGESFRGLSASAVNPQLQRVRERLVFLIALVLDKSLNERGKHHRALVERLNREGTLRGTTFLTSNYDILIDGALIEAYPDVDLDYGIEFTNPEREGDWSRPRKGKAISLLKLHGSLNWLYCPTCGSMTLTPGDKRVAKLVFSPQPCVNCGTLVIPIIIPPTFFKVMSNFHLQSIWRQAENAIRGAGRVFFCGYSFPDADIHIKYLFKRAEVHRGNPPDIFVINGRKDWNASPFREEGARFSRFFGRKARVNLTQLSFEEFCSSGVP